jgi:hypothetical protein
LEPEAVVEDAEVQQGFSDVYEECLDDDGVQVGSAWVLQPNALRQKETASRSFTFAPSCIDHGR